MTNTNNRNTRTLDRVTADAGLVAMEEPRSSHEDREWARSIVTSMHARIAEERRKRLPAPTPARKAGPVRPALLAMPRDALVAMLAKLTDALGSEVQYAHRNLDALSDNDLRRLIETIDSTPRKV